MIARASRRRYDEVSIASGGQSTEIPISAKKVHDRLQLGLRGVFDLSAETRRALLVARREASRRSSSPSSRRSR